MGPAKNQSHMPTRGTRRKAEPFSSRGNHGAQNRLSFKGKHEVDTNRTRLLSERGGGEVVEG